MTLLSIEETRMNLQDLPGWEAQGGTLVKTFAVRSFVHGVILIGAIAQLAEAAGHHPDLNLHSYSKLTVTLATHSEGGVTIKDVLLAQQIDRLP